MLAANSSPIVTTSWDDGHSKDMRVAELLGAHGVKGTFYISFNYPERPQISNGEIRTLYGMGMEIGSHTLTHRLLTGRPADEVRHELSESRKRLEDILGAAVAAFSYPQGAYTAAARTALAETGYRLGRSTVEFRTASKFDPLLMPVSAEFCRRSRTAIIRHALRDGNLAGLTNWARNLRVEPDPLRLGRLMFDDVCARGGIFHLTARSWEIDNGELWRDLEAMLGYIAGDPGIRYTTNSQALASPP